MLCRCWAHGKHVNAQAEQGSRPALGASIDAISDVDALGVHELAAGWAGVIDRADLSANVE